jgi:predicted SprT family Zn-dependent metalloprotease
MLAKDPQLSSSLLSYYQMLIEKHNDKDFIELLSKVQKMLNVACPKKQQKKVNVNTFLDKDIHH